ncbi:MAG: HAD-IIA family hydrolase [Anaerolineae bacterium]|nr:HAD-IIA family hydrolase [Anaerolineae bacterium]
MMTLRDLQALIIDMDGVLYRGDTAVPGAREFVAWLTGRSFPFVLVTNNSTLDAWAYEKRLAAMGIGVPASSILTSSVATADYVARNYGPASRVLMVGESGLESALRERGLVISGHDPDVVVVGLDRQFTYDRLRQAALAIRAGAAFVATNPDRTLPTEAGEVPGAGAIVAALVAATDVVPVVIGKPEPPMLEMALARLGQARERTGVLGDRLETDILGGQRLGLPTILVLSGVTRQAPGPDCEVCPTWVYESVRELLAGWRAALAGGA